MGRGRIWTGRVVCVLAVLMMLSDAAGKFAKPPQVLDAFTRLGLPISTAVLIGTLLTICAFLYAIPRTAILGSVLLTGYLGGAVAIQLRAGSPVFETIFPILFAVFAWGGVILCYPRLPMCLFGGRLE